MSKILLVEHILSSSDCKNVTGKINFKNIRIDELRIINVLSFKKIRNNFFVLNLEDNIPYDLYANNQKSIYFNYNDDGFLRIANENDLRYHEIKIYIDRFRKLQKIDKIVF